MHILVFRERKNTENGCELSFSTPFTSWHTVRLRQKYGVRLRALRLRQQEWISAILAPPPLPHVVLSPLPLSLSLSSYLRLRLPTILRSLPPSFSSPPLRANTVPCRVGHVMKKWRVRAPRCTSYFIISRAFLPFTVRLLSPPLVPSFSSSFFFLHLFPSFYSSHTQGGDLSSTREGKKREKKKVCCYFHSQGLPTARPSEDGAPFFLFFLITTCWILTLCLQLAAQKLCKNLATSCFSAAFSYFCFFFFILMHFFLVSHFKKKEKPLPRPSFFPPLTGFLYCWLVFGQLYRWSSSRRWAPLISTSSGRAPFLMGDLLVASWWCGWPPRTAVLGSVAGVQARCSNGA